MVSYTDQSYLSESKKISKEAYNWEKANNISTYYEYIPELTSSEGVLSSIIRKTKGDNDNFKGDWWQLILLKLACKFRNAEQKVFEGWNKWADKNEKQYFHLEGAIIDIVLEGVYLGRIVSEKMQFSGTLNNVDFSGAILKEAKFLSKRIIDTKFSNSDLHKAIFSCEKIEGTDFINAKMDFVKFKPYNEQSMNICTRFKNVSFIGASLKSSYFPGVDFFDVCMNNAELIESEFVGITLNRFGNSIFKTAKLDYTDFSGANLTRVKFNKASLVHTYFYEAVLSEVDFSEADIKNAVYENADLSGTLLYDVVFNNVNLHQANLSHIRTNEKTDFRPVKIIAGCKIERYTLESLHNKGNLTVPQLNSMEIVDDVAILRKQFSGVFHWIHIVSMVMFVTPYAWFVTKYCLLSNIITAQEPTISLIGALWRYSLLGKEWNNYPPKILCNGCLPLIFLIALVYNILRFVLFLKTKTLEDDIRVRGYYPDFSLDDKVGWNKKHLERYFLFLSIFLPSRWPAWTYRLSKKWKILKEKCSLRWRTLFNCSKILLYVFLIVSIIRAILFLIEIRVPLKVL